MTLAELMKLGERLAELADPRLGAALGLVNGLILLLQSQRRDELTAEEIEQIKRAQDVEVNEFYDLIR